MTKHDIAIRAANRNGLPLSGEAVATIRRDRLVVRLRHSWEGADGPVLAGVMAAAHELTQTIADVDGRMVELQNHRGDTLKQTYPR